MPTGPDDPTDPGDRDGGPDRTTCVPAATAGGRAADIRVIRLVRGGPMLVEGPVRIVTEDGDEVESDRFVVAVCRCHRSARYPLCDTSHRRPGSTRR